MQLGADKRLPDCEGIETSCTWVTLTEGLRPTRGCPTVRVLRLIFALPDDGCKTDKRLPDCEGIETR